MLEILSHAQAWIHLHTKKVLKETQVVHAQKKQEVARVHRRRDQNHIGSQFGPGIAVLRSSHVFEVNSHIVVLIALCTATRTHWLSKSVNSFTLNLYETFLDIWINNRSVSFLTLT